MPPASAVGLAGGIRELAEDGFLTPSIKVLQPGKPGTGCGLEAWLHKLSMFQGS